MTVQVRVFTLKDVSALVRLLNEANEGSYEYIPVTANDVRARIKERKSRTLMAEEDGEAVGSVTYNDGFWGEEVRWLAVHGRPDRKVIENELVSQAEKSVQVKRFSPQSTREVQGPVTGLKGGYKPDGGRG